MSPTAASRPAPTHRQSNHSRPPATRAGHPIKPFPSAWTRSHDKGIDRGRIEVWFADEARIGQKNKITRRWARRGTRLGPGRKCVAHEAALRWHTRLNLSLNVECALFGGQRHAAVLTRRWAC